jgi:hypothetical protein
MIFLHHGTMIWILTVLYHTLPLNTIALDHDHKECNCTDSGHLLERQPTLVSHSSFTSPYCWLLLLLLFAYAAALRYCCWLLLLVLPIAAAAGGGAAGVALVVVDVVVIVFVSKMEHVASNLSGLDASFFGIATF